MRRLLREAGLMVTGKDRNVAFYEKRVVELAQARLEVLTEGGRAETENTVSVQRFSAGLYPGCSQHGAMNRVGSDVWRCLATGCNVGARWS